MTFRASDRRGTVRAASATITVTSVSAPKGHYAVRLPLPHVGQTGTITLRGGVIFEPLTGTTYRKSAVAWGTGKCGA